MLGTREAAADAHMEARNRIRALVGIAVANGSTVSSVELQALLPPDTFASAEDLQAFVENDGVLAPELVVLDGEIAPRHATELVARRREQRRLSLDRLGMAASFAERLDRIACGVELVAISGSVAYGGAKPHDDVDFFIVARRNRLWVTLLLAMACARIDRLRNPGAPVFCFNRTTERGGGERAFRESRDPLLAREALNLRVVRGGELYGEMLRASPWMGELFPALYRARLSDFPPTAASPPSSDGVLGFLANLAAFSVLAPYLWLAGLRRNVALARDGRTEARFRTVVAWGFCAYESQKYEDLRAEYRRSF